MTFPALNVEAKCFLHKVCSVWVSRLWGLRSGWVSASRGPGAVSERQSGTELNTESSPLPHSPQATLECHTCSVTHGAARSETDHHVSCGEGPVRCLATAVPMSPSPRLGHFFCPPVLSSVPGEASKPKGGNSQFLAVL